MFSSNTSAVSGDATYVEDVFSSYLYSGNNATQTFNNGLDLSGKGGLVWIKHRTGTPPVSGSYDYASHLLFDTTRGNTVSLSTNTTNANETGWGDSYLRFLSNGFDTGSGGSSQQDYLNKTGVTYTSWTFRKQPKFFDVVTFTGTGASQSVSHSLASVPGFVVYKSTSNTSNWLVLARKSDGTYAYNLLLNATNASTGSVADAASAGLTSTTFDPSVVYGTTNGQTYVAYFFAHNAGGFGLNGTDNVISCGSFTTATSTLSVTLGYEPQWLLFKRTDAAGDWQLYDNMRGMTSGGSQRLYPNLSNAEDNGAGIQLTATGFNVNTTYNASFIYIAIRRGPMKVPTDGTKVYNAIARTGTGAVATVSGVGFAPDFIGSQNRSGDCYAWHDKLRGLGHLRSDSTAATTPSTNEVTSYTNDGCILGASSYGVTNLSATPYINHFMRRAPNFFDEVCVPTGTSTVYHNLGVPPELILIKSRAVSQDWYTYHKDIGYGPYLNSSAATGGNAAIANLTSSSFTWGATGAAYLVYMFASCPGVSKVGSYTGNGSSQTINCGFAAGARFVLIKRTDSTGDWYVWDTARGIVASTDPHLSLNTASAEVTTDDTIDPDSSGFIVNQLSATNINVSSATYIYLAIA